MQARHRHRRGAGPRRSRRLLEPAVLLLLHSNRAHGYALAESLRDMGLGTYVADMSVLYRALYDLEERGMVVSRLETEETAGPPRRVYELTAEGDAYLRDWVEELRHADHLLHRFFEAYEKHRKEHEEGG